MNINNEIKEKIYHMIGFLIALIMVGSLISLISWLGNTVINEVIL